MVVGVAAVGVVVMVVASWLWLMGVLLLWVWVLLLCVDVGVGVSVGKQRGPKSVGFVCLFVCLIVCLFVCLFVSLFVWLVGWLFVCWLVGWLCFEKVAGVGSCWYVHWRDPRIFSKFTGRLRCRTSRAVLFFICVLSFCLFSLRL